MSPFMDGSGTLGTERIALSQRERERLRVLHEVKQRHLTQVEAAKRLQATDRQVRRCLWRSKSADGALPWFTGYEAVSRTVSWRPSSSSGFWPGYGSGMRTLGLPCRPSIWPRRDGRSREAPRKWMTQAQLWHPHTLRVKAIPVWRERRACFAEMVMQDSPVFDSWRSAARLWVDRRDQ